MKILQLCNKAPFPPNDGSSIAIYNMTLGLISQNIDIHLFTLNTNKHYKSDSQVPEVFKHKTVYTSFDLNTNPTLGGAIQHVVTKKSYFISRFHDLRFEKKIVNFIEKNPVDIVQIEGLFMCSYIPAIRKVSGAKIVLRAHNLEHLIWERHIQHSSSWLKKMYLQIENKKLKQFEIETFSTVDAVVPITPKDAFFIKNLSNVALHTALTGTNIEEYKKEISPEFNTLSVFHFGSMDWIPNQEAVDWFLENCWEKIKAKIPQALFVIAGRNIPDKYKNINDSSIKIEENVPTSAEIYNKYNVMVVPVLSGSGLRIKIVEGLCFGKVIVSTSIGAEGIECQPSRDILIQDSPETFSKAIIELLEDPAKCIQIEENARKFANEHLNFEPIAQNLVAFYKKLILEKE